VIILVDKNAKAVAREPAWAIRAERFKRHVDEKPSQTYVTHILCSSDFM